MANFAAGSEHTIPTGTVTFLFTDIEGSTRLAREFPERLPAALERHHAILREALENQHGFVFQIVGDAFCAAFERAPDALLAALAAQRALRAEPWGECVIEVRMGMHTGDALARDGQYHGYLTLSHAQRLMSAASGGQVLVSAISEGLLRDGLPAAVQLRALGEVQLKDFPRAEHVFQLAAPDMPSEFAPLKSLAATPNNLPVQLTSFIGREKEMDEVKRLLASARLVTLTGSGGTGKTRLALHVAADVLRAHKDGVWFVELAPLADATLVAIAVASVLGVREEEGRSLMVTLLDWFRTRRLLLVLDNCEHLLDACARFADTALHAGPELRILATSREALGISGETAWRVPSLDIPGPNVPVQIAQLVQYTAVRLFVDRAQAALPGFGLTDTNGIVVNQICSRLDGIPLALELAAARVKSLPVEKIAERLDDRFRLLTGGSRTALPRQQTLRAAIDWSHNLLSEPERILLRRLSVFAGSWTLEAAEDVASDSGNLADILDLLTHLVDKSLVVLDDDSGRYRMFETVRQYAREKLLDTDEGSALRDRHLAFFLRLAEEAELYLTSKHRKQWMARLELEHDNLRAALQWAVEGHTEAALRLAAALHWFWYFGSYFSEGQEWYRRILAVDDTIAYPHERARTLLYAGFLASLNSVREAEAWLHESINLLRPLNDKAQLERALRHLTMALVIHDRPGEARAYIDEAISLSRELGDKRELGLGLCYLGRIVAATDHDLDLSRAHQLESFEILREVGDPYALAVPRGWLGWIALEKGDYAAARQIFGEDLLARRQNSEKWTLGIGLSLNGCMERMLGDYVSARQLLTESLQVFDSIGAQRNTVQSVRWLGHLALDEGDRTQAESLFRQSLAISRELAIPSGIVLALAGLARVLAFNERPLTALRIFGSIEQSFPGSQQTLSDRIDRDRTRASLRAQLSDAAYQAALNEGRTLALEQAIALALEEPHG